MNAISTEQPNDFSKKMTDILNYGALNLSMAIGYRTGLFDVMGTFNTPQTVSVIALKAGLNPRYVTEWLGAMVTGGIIEWSQEEQVDDRFFLPKSHADLITRQAGSGNMGVYTQEIPLLTTCAMEPVIQGFYSGEGVSYDHYPRFQAFMSELANGKHRQVLVENFLPSIFNGELIGQLQSGIRVCDLGCGEGIAAILMAEAFPESLFVGIDISEEALQKARSAATQAEIGNLEFIKMDAAALKDHRPFKESFDYVTAFDAIHDQTRPLDVLRGVHSILKSRGIFTMVDIAARSNLGDNLDHPMGPFLYTVSLMHCMPVGFVEGGSGLGMMWGREKAVEMLGEAGFDRIEVCAIPGDPFNLHFLCSK